MSDTVSEVAIGPLDGIPRGEGRNFVAGGRTVAVFRTHGDEVFATQPECPHLKGPLADGMMGGTTIMCPLHDRMYDLRTGAVLVGECDLVTYPARVVSGTIFVSI